jgi:putative restriction endonuclease
MTTEEAISLLYDLHRDRSSGHEKPHKPVLLLAVMDLIERGEIANNQITPSKELRAGFTAYFNIVKQGNDNNSPENPFYYLCNESFWNIYPKRPAGALSWGKLSSEGLYVSIQEELYAMMCNPMSREILREAIYSRYFAEHRALLQRVCNEQTHVEHESKVFEDPLPGRDAAFRKVVIDVYDYRCAACGLRLNLDGIVMVEAAHLIPWSESHDDNPRNGMALCRNHHYAMDRHLIAPSPDMRWMVSDRLDDRRDGEAGLVKLNKLKVLAPKLDQYLPRPEALEWRCTRLLA